jgi:dTDP-4-dehydrorhamnose 3,5-epimerase-like enzyme
VRWDDPALAIEWPPAERRIVSAKDQSWPDLEFRR